MRTSRTSQEGEGGMQPHYSHLSRAAGRKEQARGDSISEPAYSSTVTSGRGGGWNPERVATRSWNTYVRTWATA